MVGRALIALIEPVRISRPCWRGIICCAAALQSTQTATRLVSEHALEIGELEVD